MLNFEFFFHFLTLGNHFGGHFWRYLRVYFIVENVTFPLFDRFASVLPKFCSALSELEANFDQFFKLLHLENL